MEREPKLNVNDVKSTSKEKADLLYNLSERYNLGMLKDTLEEIIATSIQQEAVLMADAI